MSIFLVLAAALLFALSGIPKGRLGPLVAVVACFTGLAGIVAGFGAAPIPSLDVAWAVPGGRFSVALDALGMAFLLPVLIIPALGAVYGHAYFPPDHPTFRRTRLAFGILPASMVLVVLARHAFLLLVAWEGMALSAFFLLAADDHESAVRASSWVYLVATHVGTLCLMAAFGILAHHTGGLALEPVRGLSVSSLRWSAVLLLIGFGMKAGIVPLHFWLPGAHANAPSHVSAVMSGVVLNMGVYGLMRMASFLGQLPSTMGGVLLAMGALSAIFGAAFSVVQSDLKRLLAYSSVDNMAIAIMGLGLALVGRATGRDDLLSLGVAGAVWHVWNHSLFKSLLFFASGAVVHATGTRRMDLMGGLARSMPVTALVTLVGAVALAGLPPLNGFLGELVLYMGLARSATGIGWPALAMPALAMTGALAVVAMVKVYGGAFLGEARQPMKPHDPPLAMRATMGILAAACIVVVPAAVTLGPALDRVTLAFAFRPIPSLATLVPLGNVTMLLLAAAALAGGVIYWARRSRRGAASPQGTAGTWACGYAMPSPRIQYTPTSFSELVMGLFRGFLSLREFRPTLQGVFPRRSLFAFAVRDPVLDRAAVPVIGVIERSATWLRLTQQGNVQVYVLYIVLALLGLLWVG